MLYVIKCIYYIVCFLARSIKGFLWINGRYNSTFDAFTFLDGTLVPTEMLELRDKFDLREKAYMTYYDFMLWRDRKSFTLFGFICGRDNADLVTLA